MSETLTDDYYQKLLTEAIYGNGLSSIEYAIDMENKGLAKFCGNQHNEAWEWNKDALMGLSISELEQIYKKVS